MMPELDGFAVASRIRELPGCRHMVLLMLTSSGQLGDGARCRSLGIDRYLIKPVKQADLLDAMLTALGSRSPVPKPAPEPSRAAEVAPCRALDILLVEDNAINQKLVERMLQPLGHRVTTAADGRAALAVLARDRFDLILMDVQLPLMDGFEATAAIRAAERDTGGHVPIVAMTAHAMKGDRERCLSAGMDAYVAKPVDRHELLATLAQFAPPPGASAAVPSAAESKPAPDLAP